MNNHDMIARQIKATPEDSTLRGVFADSLEEDRTPGAHIVRAAMNDPRATADWEQRGEGDKIYQNFGGARGGNTPALFATHFPRRGILSTVVVHPYRHADTSQGFIVHRAASKSLQQLYKLLRDFPESTRNEMLRAAQKAGMPTRHVEETPVKLAAIQSVGDNTPASVTIKLPVPQPAANPAPQTQAQPAPAPVPSARRGSTAFILPGSPLGGAQ